MIMVNTDSPLSRTPFMKNNKKWNEFWKDSSSKRNKEFLQVETLASTSFGAAVLKGNFFIQETYMIPVSSFDQSGENLLRLLHGESSGIATQNPPDFTGTSFSGRLSRPRPSRISCCNGNSSSSISSQTTSASNYSDRKMGQRAGPSTSHTSSPQQEFFESSSSPSSLSPLSKHHTEALVSSPPSPPPSNGKSLLEMLRQNNCSKGAICSAVNANATISRRNDMNIATKETSIRTPEFPLLSTVSHQHSNNGTTEIIKEDSDNNFGSRKKMVLSKQRGFSISDCTIYHNFSDVAPSIQSVLSSTGLSSSTSVANISEVSCSKPLSSHPFYLSPTQSSPGALPVHQRRLTTSLIDSCSSGYDYQYSNTNSSSPASLALCSDSLSQLVGTPPFVPTSFTRAPAKGFSAVEIASIRKRRPSSCTCLKCSCRQSDYKFANPLYMRSPEPNAIPFPSWERSPSAPTTAATF